MNQMRRAGGSTVEIRLLTAVISFSSSPDSLLDLFDSPTLCFLHFDFNASITVLKLVLRLGQLFKFRS